MFGYRNRSLRWYYPGGSRIFMVPAGCILVVSEVPSNGRRVFRVGGEVSEGLAGRLEGLLGRL
jgi:hypothetical protein